MGIDRERRGYTPKRASHALRVFAPDSRAGAEISESMSGALEQFTNLFQAKILRSGVYAAAKVISSELKTRVPKKTGALYGSIFHYHDDKRSVNGHQVYLVGYNKVKAPHWFNVEYGHWRVNVGRYVDGEWIPSKRRLAQPKWVEAKPYLRSTFDAKAGEAVRAAIARMGERMREIRDGEE